jgi:hypothetical protein
MFGQLKRPQLIGGVLVCLVLGALSWRLSYLGIELMLNHMRDVALSDLSRHPASLRFFSETPYPLIFYPPFKLFMSAVWAKAFFDVAWDFITEKFASQFLKR